MKAHWIKFAPADFLNGVVDLTPEQTGAYFVVLCLIWDRGGPIPDDEGWLARRIHVSRLKWRALREQLLALGKLQLDAHGNLTNRRAMQEVARVRQISEKRAAASDKRWHGETDLFGGGSDAETAENGHSRDANASNTGGSGAETAELRGSGDANAFSGHVYGSGKPPAKPPEKTGGYVGKNEGGMSPKKTTNGLNSNETADANAFFPSRGRAREQELDKNIHPTSNDPSRAQAGVPAREGPGGGGIYDLAMACADAAGLSARFASRPALVTQSIEIVQGWIASGVDIRAQAVPWIEAAADAMDEPAHSLAKFTAMIDTKASRAKRQRTKLGRSPVDPPPAKPQLQFDDEAPPMAAFRAALAKVLPTGDFVRFCNNVRFVATDWRAEGDQAMLIVTPRTRHGWTATDPAQMLEQRHGQTLTGIARKVLGAETVAVRPASLNNASEPPR